MSQRVAVVAVLPNDSTFLKRLIKNKWCAFRCNEYTQSVYRVYDNEEYAMADARVLPPEAVWALERYGNNE